MKSNEIYLESQEAMCTTTDDQLKQELKNIIMSLYDGSSFSIGKLLAVFRKTLESKNIQLPNPPKMYNLFYAVKNELEKMGYIKTIKHSIYYVNSEGVEDYTEESAEEISSDDDTEAEEGCLTLGSGLSSVYLWYFPSYKELAKLRGEDTYRVKIGQSSDIKKRLASSTDDPEHKKVALLIHTDRPDEIEKILQSMLIVQGKQADAPGKEWFFSNETEVIELYNRIAPFVCPADDIHPFE